MATLQVRDIDDDVYNSLKMLAKKDHRSISQEVANILEAYVKMPDKKHSFQTEEFLSLKWSGRESAEALIEKIKPKTKESRRFGEKNGLFD